MVRKLRPRKPPSPQFALSLLGTRYPIHRQLWAGEHTERHEGEHPETGAMVVLEVLRPALRADPDAMARFRLMNALRVVLLHPSLMPLSDTIVGGDFGTLGIVSATGIGVYMDQIVRKVGVIEPAIVALMGLTAGEAMLHLERKSAELSVPLVHGSFGPEHVFVCEDGSMRIDGIGSFVFTAERDTLIQIGEELTRCFPVPTLQ